MIKGKQLLWVALLLLFIVVGCNEDKFDPYARPDWLQGKVYTQMTSAGNEDLSTFAYCVQKVKYDSIIDRTGSYTVFAPTNAAFEAFFASHPSYKKVDDIPLAELEKIVKFHIVQNPWRRDQFRQLDVYGWIDTLSLYNNEPHGFKRETVLRNSNRKYGVKNRNLVDVSIVDTTATTWHRRVYTDSRKFAPIFFQEYFRIKDLTFADYKFYFDRDFEQPNDLYFGGAKVLDKDILAENGFIYRIDRVVEPMKNASEILASTNKGHSYKKFFDLVNYFAKFAYNETETFKQPGADLGLQVDSLFELAFPELVFGITNEKTHDPQQQGTFPAYYSVSYQHGLVAPTDEAFDKLLRHYVQGNNQWGALARMPDNIKSVIVNAYMSPKPIYQTDVVKGFRNGENEIVKIDPANIVHREFGSNATFIGVKEPIIPRAFSSVAGAVYTQSTFASLMLAIDATGMLTALKREGENYVFFVVNDESCLTDSSLIVERTLISKREFFNFLTFEGVAQLGSPRTKRALTVANLRSMLMNQVGLWQPKGLARKEFIRTLSGNYIVVNNETGEVRGTAPTKFGFNGKEVPIFPTPLSFSADNGRVYNAKHWFKMSEITIYDYISVNYPDFQNLLVKAGMALPKEYRYNFISESQQYTVLVPTKAALEAANANALVGNQLVNFLKTHFIQGDIIFTDGNKTPGYYETLRESESSTAYSKVYSKIYVNPIIDKIELFGKNGAPMVTINESPKANVIASRNLNASTVTSVVPNRISNVVIHEIDTALLFGDLDAK
jgi:uncharacterized surface protein with fasciclin (FAS1) repeats